MRMVQRGFTLIELVMVIVILGILAAVAVPKYMDLSSNASLAATQGVAASITSASAMNYAARAITTTANNTTKIDATFNCNTAAAALLLGGVPSGFTVTPTAFTGLSAGSTQQCGVTGQGGQIATATVMLTTQ